MAGPDDLEAPTTPDRLDAGAYRELELLYGERIARCWRTGLGFLVMTNLRCLHLWKKPELFARPEWHTGPTFFFYNLAAPRVVGDRFLELSDEQGTGGASSRFLVRDPRVVRDEIDAARAAGRAEWISRRREVQKELHRLRGPVAPPGTTVIVREVVKVRCVYCGSLMNLSEKHCPECGAPQR